LREWKGESEKEHMPTLDTLCNDGTWIKHRRAIEIWWSTWK
jgi:hypothetical protein